MGQAIGQVLSLGVGVALSLIPIVGAAPMLVTPGALAVFVLLIAAKLIGDGISGLSA